MILVITGASGVGKTTITKYIAQKVSDRVEVHHFDDIGIPDWSTVLDVEAWQRRTTLTWITKLVELTGQTGKAIVFEGAAAPAFLREAFAANTYADYEIVLFDCTEATMQERLEERGQAELYTEDMRNWLKHLRAEAKRLRIPVIETDRLSVEEIVNKLLVKING